MSYKIPILFVCTSSSARSPIKEALAWSFEDPSASSYQSI